MITRFYVDNYKCLQNFEYKPKQFELILGANGSGKSTVFEALNKVCAFIRGEQKAEEIFMSNSRTRWSNNWKQRFELEIQDLTVKVKYELVIEYPELLDSLVVASVERLYVNDELYIEALATKPPEGMNLSEWTLYREARFSRPHGKITEFPISNPDYSIMSSQWGMPIFNRLNQILQFRLNPTAMSASTEKEEYIPNTDLSNLPAYYAHLLPEKQGKAFDLTKSLREVIAGFDQFSLSNSKEGRTLVAIMSEPEKNTKYSFDELSDGQRSLIALYLLLHCTLEPRVTLIIDEPENYVALRELQPWLLSLEEKIEEEGGQVILISHHPEFINMLAPERAVVFERIDSGPVRIRDFSMNGVESITPAELVARGWESDGE